MPRLTGSIEWAIYNRRSRELIGTVDAIVSPEPLEVWAHARVTASIQFKLGSCIDTDIVPVVHTWSEVIGEERNL